MSTFASLSPDKDPQCFFFVVSIQSLIAFLATHTEMPQAGSGPINGHSDLNFAS
jgi:hypothetical protein